MQIYKWCVIVLLFLYESLLLCKIINENDKIKRTELLFTLAVNLTMLIYIWAK